MAFSVISISSDSSKESMGASTARVILFGMIPTTIPPTTPTTDLPIIHDDTLLTPTISPTIPIIPPIAPTIQYISLFINTDSSDSGTLNSPPSQDPYESVPIPVGRPYRSSPMRHSSLGYSISDSLDDSLTAASARPSRNRCRSLTSSVLVVFLVRGALSPVRADLSPPPKRIRDSDSVTNLEVSLEDGYEPYIHREGMDDRDVVETTFTKEVESSMRGTIEAEVDPRVGPVVDYDVRESVREDVFDHVIADGAIEVTYKTLGDLVQRFHDHVVEIAVHRI
nr:hypothetical protein [Tanacetum cinerariifolium]